MALSDAIDSSEEPQTLIVDLDSDGLSDRIQYVAHSRQLIAEQGYGANGELYRLSSVSPVPSFPIARTSWHTFPRPPLM